MKYLNLITLLLLGFTSLNANAVPTFQSYPNGLQIENGTALLTFANQTVNGNVADSSNTGVWHKQAQGHWDFNVNGGANGTSFNLNLALPNKAVITGAYLDIYQQILCQGTNAKIDITANTLSDIFPQQGACSLGWGSTGLVVLNGNRPFNGAIYGVSPLAVPGTTGSLLKLTAATGVTMNVTGNANLLGGAFNIYVDYFISN